jgi:hypothetical protein
MKVFGQHREGMAGRRLLPVAGGRAIIQATERRGISGYERPRAISDLPQAPGVYVIYGGRRRGRYVACVGIAQKLRDRIVQHFVRSVMPSLYLALV